MLRSGNVATPAEAAASDLPERRALGTLGSLPSASVTTPVKLVMTLPAESNTVTCTGWMMLSFMASVGGAVNASLVELDPRGGAWPPPGALLNSLSKGHPATSAATSATRSVFMACGLEDANGAPRRDA